MMRKALLLFFVLVISSAAADDFYDIFTIQTIEITFEESNWDALLDKYYSNDNNEKLLASAVINGMAYDSIGVKYKGNSTYSASNAKNPLHLYLDYVIDDQNYDGYESIKLSNGKNDPSFVREVLSYEIARKYTAAPQSNYAKVYINGDYYGLFSSSEAINGDFVDRRLYADNKNVRVKCNPENTDYGNGPSLEYLGSDSSSYYVYYDMKSDYGWQEFIDFMYALENDANNIENYLDIDRAIWMMAFNNVLVNLDSYVGPFRQNYYMIQDDNDRFVPVTWDLNESFGAFESIDMGGGGGGGGRPGSTPTTSSLAELDPYLREGDDSYPLVDLIFSNERYTKMYFAHCKTMLEDNFTSGWYAKKADSLQTLIKDAVSSDDNAFYSVSQFTGNIDGTQSSTIGITELMEDRITFLQSESVYKTTPPVVSEIIAPTTPAAYSTVSVTALITDATYVYLAYRYSKDDVFVKVEMHDDGLHNDGAANDNVYGVGFEVDEKNTHYYIYAENDEAAVFSPANAELEYYKIAAEALEDEASDVVINEVMASNASYVTDSYGDYDDWVELYNNTSEDVSLLGYYLTDDKDELTQWPFPDVTINSGEYLVVWCDKDDEQEGLHANFKLSASGEDVYLVNSEYTIVNSVSFDEQQTDMGYARTPNATGDFVIQSPTFNFDNMLASNIEDSQDLQVLMFPNPVEDILTIKTTEQITGVTIYTMTGASISVSLSTSSEGYAVGLSDLQSGSYLMKYTTTTGFAVSKIVVK